MIDSAVRMPPLAARPSPPDTLTETVSPWTVLMAVRYGLGRLTYAHYDAVSLVVRHWDVLAPSRDSILADLMAVERNTLLPSDIRESAADLIAWIEMREIVRAQEELLGDQVPARA